jgi:hypothetical protein
MEGLGVVMERNVLDKYLLRLIFDIEDSVARNIESIIEDKELKALAQEMANEIKAEIFLLPYGSVEYGNFGTPCWVIDSRKELVMFREIKKDGDGWEELKSLAVQFVSYKLSKLQEHPDEN